MALEEGADQEAVKAGGVSGGDVKAQAGQGGRPRRYGDVHRVEVARLKPILE